MNEGELEGTSRPYRLVVSPPSTRQPIVRRPRGRVVPASAWMPTATALVAASVFYWLSAYERAAVQLAVDHSASARAASIRLVSRSLGGGSQSLLAAEFVVWLDEPKAVETRK